MLSKYKLVVSLLLSSFNQTGNSLVILLLIVGFLTGGVLIEQKFGKGLPSEPSPSPQAIQYNAAFTLSADRDLSSLKSGDTFIVTVNTSTKDSINLISAKIKYPKESLKVTSVDDLGDESPITLWVSKEDFPEEGLVQLVGGIPNPGLKTDGESKTFAKINFQLIKADNAFEIKPEDIQLYSNSTNQPLENVQTISLSSTKPAASPVEPSATPSPIASVTPLAKGVLSLNPKIIQTANGCTFDLVLSYDSGGSNFIGIDALLTIDPRVIKPISILRTSNSPDSMFAPQLALKNDTITIAYLSPSTRQYQTKADLGKITFKVTDQPAQGMTAIKIKHGSGSKNILSDSNILYSLQEDLLTEVNNSFVVIKPGSCQQEKTFEIIKSR
jgi:hypothetical protein